MVMRDTLAFVVEHLASTSNFKAGPEDEGREDEACPFMADMPGASAFAKERILSICLDAEVIGPAECC